MTIRQFLANYLYNNGLFEVQANAILDELATEERATEIPFNKESEGYPKVFLATVMLVAKHKAAEWLEKNMPNHWARPMFDDKLMADIEKEQPVIPTLQEIEAQ